MVVLIFVFFAASLYLSAKINFQHLHSIKLGFKQLFSIEETGNGISKFASATLAMAARMGSMNIVGVTFGISLGGYGVLFWLWIFTFITMATAFYETILAQIYKTKGDNNKLYSGPMVYITRGLPPKYKILAPTYCILIILTTGLLYLVFQVNSITGMVTAFSGYSSYFHLEIVVILLIIIAFLYYISGGAKQITRLSAYIVPVLIVTFLTFFLRVVIENIEFVPSFFQLVITSAISPKAFLGGSVISAFVIGTFLGQISNESGMGLSTLATGSTEVDHPYLQGGVNMVTLLFDSLTCSITGFVIILAQQLDPAISEYSNPFSVIIYSFDSVYDGGNLLVLLLIIIFSFTTIISSVLYGMKALHFLYTNEKYKLARKIYIGLVIVIIIVSQLLTVTSNMFVMILLVPSVLLLCINYFAIFKLKGVAISTINDFKNGNQKFKSDELNIEFNDNQENIWK